MKTNPKKKKKLVDRIILIQDGDQLRIFCDSHDLALSTKIRNFFYQLSDY
jgi:hypothetical protein